MYDIIHISRIIRGLFHLGMWQAQYWVVMGLREGLFPSVIGCSHGGIHRSIRHMCSSLWMFFKRQWTIPNVEATCDYLSHLRNQLKYCHNATMCKVKPKGASICKIKGLQHGCRSNFVMLWENTYHPWALCIIKHKANDIMNLNISRPQGIGGWGVITPFPWKWAKYFQVGCLKTPPFSRKKAHF